MKKFIVIFKNKKLLLLNIFEILIFLICFFALMPALITIFKSSCFYFLEFDTINSIGQKNIYLESATNYCFIVKNLIFEIYPLLIILFIYFYFSEKKSKDIYTDRSKKIVKNCLFIFFTLFFLSTIVLYVFSDNFINNVKTINVTDEYFRNNILYCLVSAIFYIVITLMFFISKIMINIYRIRHIMKY